MKSENTKISPKTVLVDADDESTFTDEKGTRKTTVVETEPETIVDSVPEPETEPPTEETPDQAGGKQWIWAIVILILVIVAISMYNAYHDALEDV